MELPGKASAFLAPLVTVGDLRLHPVSVIVKGCGYGRGDLARLRGALSAAYAAARPRAERPDGTRATEAGVPGKGPCPAAKIPALPPYDPGTPVLDHVVSCLEGATLRERTAAMGWLVRNGCGPATRWNPVDENERAARVRAFARIEARTRMMELLGAEIARLAASPPLALEDLLSAPWSAGLPESSALYLLRTCAGLRPLPIGDVRLVVPVEVGNWNLRLRGLQEVLCQADPDEPARAVAARFGAREGGSLGDCLSRLALLVMGDFDAFVALTRVGLWRKARAVALGGEGCPTSSDEIRGRLAALDADAGRPGPRIDPRHRDRLAALRDVVAARLARMEASDRRALGVWPGDAVHLARQDRRDAKAAERLAAWEARRKEREDKVALRLAALSAAASERGRVAGLCAGVMYGRGPHLRWDVPTLARLIAADAGGDAAPDGAAIAEALAAGEEFVRLGRARWGLADTGGNPEGSPEERVAEALALYGGPLTTEALADLARMGSRGAGGFVPDPKGRVVELMAGVWGLAERDYRPDPRARPVLAEALMRRFSAGTDDVGDLFAGAAAECRAAGVMDVAGLATFLARELGLSTNARGRAHAREVNVSARRRRLEAAFALAFDGPKASLTLDEACEIARAMLGGPTNRTSVADAILAVGETDGDGVWRKRCPTTGRRAAGPARPGGHGRDDWWTPERETLLRTLFDAGVPADDVRAAMRGFGTRT